MDPLNSNISAFRRKDTKVDSQQRGIEPLKEDHRHLHSDSKQLSALKTSTRPVVRAVHDSCKPELALKRARLASLSQGHVYSTDLTPEMEMRSSKYYT